MNRWQYVSINDFDSDCRNVSCGVPQGSSLLFLVCINDFRLCLNETETGHFAETIETIVNTELKRVSTWLRLNKLSLNRDQTELVFFHSRRNTLNHDNISIKFEGKKLIPVDHVKYLGVYIGKHLSWNFHILQLSKKLS